MFGIGILLRVSGSVRERHIEPGEKQGPTGLARVQPLGGLNIFQVLMVCPY